MPEHWLTEAERLRLTSYPIEVAAEDLVTFFTLTESDHKFLSNLRYDANRLGCALQLCALRYLGFVPDALPEAPATVTEFLARQLGVMPDSVNSYAVRAQTRTDHLQEIESYLGFHKATPAEKAAIERWLVERAMEHDRPLLLLQMLCERLQALKLVRRGVTLLERAVTKARQEARTIIWQTVSPLITDETTTALAQLLIVDEQGKRTPLHWLRTGATSHSAAAILGVLEKIVHLRQLGVERWDFGRAQP